MIRKVELKKRLDLNNLTAQVSWEVPLGLSATAHYVPVADAIGTAQVTMYRSNNGSDWVEFPTPGIVLTPAAPMSDPFNITEVLYIAARTSTEEGSDLLGDVVLCVAEDV